MDLGTGWWIAAGLLVVAELLTGTFYLLMLALGLAAAAIAAQLGFGFVAQAATAALVGGGAVVLWHLRRPRRGAASATGANPDVMIDIGGHVQVAQWQSDGSARVHYRGASWAARYDGPVHEGLPPAGTYTIHALDGSTLVLRPAPHKN